MRIIDKRRASDSASHCGAVALPPGKKSESPWRRSLARYATFTAAPPQGIGTRLRLIILNDVARWWSGVTMHAACVAPNVGSNPVSHASHRTRAQLIHTPAQYAVLFVLTLIDFGPNRS